MKYYIYSIPLILFLTACGENGSSAPDTPAAVPSAPAVDGAPMVETLQPQLHGGCEANTTITLYADDQKVAASTACVDGTYSVRPEAPLTHGRHCFSVQATNASGADSERSKSTCVFTGRPFVIVWKTDNGGITNNNQIAIVHYYNNYTYNYSVDWGDGTSEMNLTADVIHTYSSPGVYTVKINGVFPWFVVPEDDYPDDRTVLEASDKRKLLAVSQWGSIPWQTMNSSFFYCLNADFNATDIPDLSHTTSLAGAFSYISSVPKNIGKWDISKITTLERTFKNNSAISNMDINDWNVSSVVNMEQMFSNTGLTTANYDKLLNSWSKQPVKHDVLFSAGNSHYSPSAAAARSILTDQYGWTIHDGGPVAGE